MVSFCCVAGLGDYVPPFPGQVVFGAIRQNKHVITANKALVATYLAEIQELLKDHPGVTFGYEAAVCGGEASLNIVLDVRFANGENVWGVGRVESKWFGGSFPPPPTDEHVS